MNESATQQPPENYRINQEAELRFRRVRDLDLKARTLRDFLGIAMLLGHPREWAETKYALRMAGKA